MKANREREAQTKHADVFLLSALAVVALAIHFLTNSWYGYHGDEYSQDWTRSRHGKLGSDIGKGRRANYSKERRRMARCRYQDGYLFT